MNVDSTTSPPTANPAGDESSSVPSSFPSKDSTTLPEFATTLSAASQEFLPPLSSFTCNVCKKVLANDRNLKIHLQKVHGQVW